MTGDDIEREDQVARVVEPADLIADVDVQHAGLHRVEADPDIPDLDPRLPALQGLADVVRDLPGGRRGGGVEHVVMDPAAELRPHRPLAARRAEDEPDRLLELAVRLTSATPPVASVPSG